MQSLMSAVRPIVMARFALLLTLLCVFSFGMTQRRPAKHGQTPLAVSTTADSGLVLYLSDGSAWEIRHENRDKAKAWPKGARVGIYRTEDHDYPYRLLLRPGQSDGDIISAKRLQRVRWLSSGDTPSILLCEAEARSRCELPSGASTSVRSEASLQCAVNR